MKKNSLKYLSIALALGATLTLASCDKFNTSSNTTSSQTTTAQSNTNSAKTTTPTVANTQNTQNALSTANIAKSLANAKNLDKQVVLKNLDLGFTPFLAQVGGLKLDSAETKELNKFVETYVGSENANNANNSLYTNFASDLRDEASVFTADKPGYGYPSLPVTTGDSAKDEKAYQEYKQTLVNHFLKEVDGRLKIYHDPGFQKKFFNAEQKDIPALLTEADQLVANYKTEVTKLTSGKLACDSLQGLNTKSKCFRDYLALIANYPTSLNAISEKDPNAVTPDFLDNSANPIVNFENAYLSSPLAAAKPVNQVASTVDAAKTVVSNLASEVKDTANSAVNSIKESASKVVSSVTNSVSATTDKAKESVNTAVESAKEKASSVAEEAKEKASTAVEAAKEKASSVAEAAKEKASSAVEAAKDKANSVATEAKEKASSAVEAAKEKASSAVEAAKEKASSVAQAAKEKASSAVESVKESASSAVEAAKEKASTAVEAAKEKASSVVSSVKNTVVNTTSSAVEAAKDKASSVVESAKEKASSVVEAAKDKASDLVNKGKDLVSTASGKAAALATGASGAAMAAHSSLSLPGYTYSLEKAKTLLEAAKSESDAKAVKTISDVYPNVISQIAGFNYNSRENATIEKFGKHFQENQAKNNSLFSLYNNFSLDMDNEVTDFTSNESTSYPNLPTTEAGLNSYRTELVNAFTKAVSERLKVYHDANYQKKYFQYSNQAELNTLLNYADNLVGSYIALVQMSTIDTPKACQVGSVAEQAKCFRTYVEVLAEYPNVLFNSYYVNHPQDVVASPYYYSRTAQPVIDFVKAYNK